MVNRGVRSKRPMAWMVDYRRADRRVGHLWDTDVPLPRSLCSRALRGDSERLTVMPVALLSGTCATCYRLYRRLEAMNIAYIIG